MPGKSGTEYRVHERVGAALQISVVIPTFNRGSVLARTLACLEQQTLNAELFEVLVVDDGSSDDTERVVTASAKAARFSLRYFKHENRGPGYTQNRGIGLARAALVLLLADDMWATPQLLEQHVAAHQREPGVNVAILGQVVQSAQLPPTHLHRYWDPFAFHELAGRRELTSLHFWACNISVYRDFLLKNGLFLERGGAANEDMELGFRLGKHGLRVIYEPAALTSHYHIETVHSICRRGYEQGRNFDVLHNVPRAVLMPFCGMFTLRAGGAYAMRATPRAVVRGVFFNLWVVNRFWLPLLEQADRKRLLRFIPGRPVYRAVFGCYCRKGIRDLSRKSFTGCSI
jgi:glycosyltransferase involved in cell wall biosynthesis